MRIARTAQLVALTALLVACSGAGGGGGGNDEMLQRAQAALKTVKPCETVIINTWTDDATANPFLKAGLTKKSGINYVSTPLLLKVGNKTEDANHMQICPARVVADSIVSSSKNDNGIIDVIVNTHLEWQPWATSQAVQDDLKGAVLNTDYQEDLDLSPTTVIHMSRVEGRGWICTVAEQNPQIPCGS